MFKVLGVIGYSFSCVAFGALAITTYELIHPECLDILYYVRNIANSYSMNANRD